MLKRKDDPTRAVSETPKPNKMVYTPETNHLENPTLSDYSDYSRTHLQNLCRRVETRYSLPANLLAAIVTQESNWNTHATRIEWNWFKRCSNPKDVLHFVQPEANARRNIITQATEEIMQSMSWGLGQVMGGRARELGLLDPIPTLLHPLTGLKYAAAHYESKLKYHEREPRTHIRRAGLNPAYIDAIAAYNWGVARVNEQGEYLNKEYVDAVLAHMAILNAAPDQKT